MGVGERNPWKGFQMEELSFVESLTVDLLSLKRQTNWDELPLPTSPIFAPIQSF